MTAQDFKDQLTEEGKDILNFWMTHVIDIPEERIYGQINNDNSKDRDANLSGVLMARLVWTFSRAFSEFGIAKYGRYAQFCFEYMMDHFWDVKMGGLFWEVASDGDVEDPRKLIYVQAFGLYALSEYDRALGNAEARELAERLFRLMESHGWDGTGYREGVNRDWTPGDQASLSEKEEGASKTMNTHLHVMEAYANYLDVLGAKGSDLSLDVEKALEKSIRIVLDKIYDPQAAHLNLFFTDGWQIIKKEYSPGHDIEAAWLLLEAVEILRERGSVFPVGLRVQTEGAALKLIEQTLKTGLRKDGSLIPEYAADKEFTDFKDNNLISEWWTMAEAWTGFLDAFLMTKNEEFYKAAVQTFTFVKKRLKDPKGGEWFWGYTPEGELDPRGKAGFWKCPYHSFRGCVEGAKRLSRIDTNL